MYLYKDIVKDSEKSLREKSNDVSLPLSEEDYKILSNMREYLINGYEIDPSDKESPIKPGVGIAASQVGHNKKMFCVMAYDEKGNYHEYNVINPKIISYSEEKCYLTTGEGCLSVDLIHSGYIHRSKRIKAKVTLYDFETNTYTTDVLKLSGYIAIVFQHEYDHLFGVLFYDHINKDNPFYIPDVSKPIVFDED